MADFLRYGAIGLGLALAVLAFQLLQREQKVPRPRMSIIKTIYVFLGFALVLSALGFALEYAKFTQESARASAAVASTSALNRLRAASLPLLRSRKPVIDSLPDDLHQKPQLLVFQAELRKILEEVEEEQSEKAK